MARTLKQHLGEAERLAEKYAGIAAFAMTEKGRAWAGQKSRFWLQRVAELQAALNKEGAEEPVKMGRAAFGVCALLPGRKNSSYLKGPRTSKEVRKLGYAFTDDAAEAWRFPSAKKAKQKARIVGRHMQWGDGRMTFCDLPNKEGAAS